LRRTFSLVQDFAALLGYKFPQLPSGNDSIFDIVCAAYRANNACSANPVWRLFSVGTANEAFHVLRLACCDLTQIQRAVRLAVPSALRVLPKANRAAREATRKPPVSFRTVRLRPRRRRSRQRNRKRVAAQHHERDQPLNRLFTVRAGAQEARMNAVLLCRTRAATVPWRKTGPFGYERGNRKHHKR
jgi:hypothetical protein